jgi:hypothetical protein
MSNGKVKTYKNPDRNKPEDYKPYVPQYIVEGKEPREYKSAVLSDTVIAVKQASEDNPRTRKAAIRQPYAEAVPSPVGRGRGPIPNVGNNVEHTWSSVDGEIFDDLSGEQQLDPNHPMVDNNDFVSPAALGLQQEELPMLDEVQNPTPKQFVQASPVPGTPKQMFSAPPSGDEDLFPIVRDLEQGAYLLIVGGVPVCSGPKEEIEDQAKAFIFGEHEMCDGNPIPDDDIVIIKRVPIKIGLFLE